MKIFSEPITGSETAASNEMHQALIDFYRAFNHGNLQQMRENWAGEESIMCNPLGGLRRGMQEIEPVYDAIFNGPAEVYVEFYDYTLFESPQMFCAAGRERGYFKTADAKIDLDIRTSRIYAKIDGRWRQLHHHGSITESNLLRNYQQAVAARQLS